MFVQLELGISDSVSMNMGILGYFKSSLLDNFLPSIIPLTIRSLRCIAKNIVHPYLPLACDTASYFRNLDPHLQKYSSSLTNTTNFYNQDLGR